MDFLPLGLCQGLRLPGFEEPNKLDKRLPALDNLLNNSPFKPVR